MGLLWHISWSWHQPSWGHPVTYKPPILFPCEAWDRYWVTISRKWIFDTEKGHLCCLIAIDEKLSTLKCMFFENIILIHPLNLSLNKKCVLRCVIYTKIYFSWQKTWGEIPFRFRVGYLRNDFLFVTFPNVFDIYTIF